MLAWLSTSQAHAAVVAVMPVRGVNLSPGECDAIGVIFAEAYAQEAHIEVLTPIMTGPAIEHSGTSQAAAAQLEATVTSAQLARALAWRQPVPDMPVAPTGVEPIPKTAPSDVSPGPHAYTKALGIKVGISQPVARGRSFYPVEVLAFDARLGTRAYFVEFGGGVNISPATRTTASKATMEAWFTEVGGSVYLTCGAIAPYLGVGISPRFTFIDGARKDDGIRLAVYGQTGVTFTRDSKSRIYSELRVSQNLLPIAEYASDGTTRLRSYHPTEFAMQVGVGW
jgi:hypothetical protein